MAEFWSKLVAKPEEVQKQAEDSIAVKTQATDPGKKAIKKIEEDKDKPKEKFDPKGAIKTFEDNATEAFNRPDKFAKGDELHEQLVGQSTAAQVQAEKPKEAYNEANPDKQTLDVKKEQVEEMNNTPDEEVKAQVSESTEAVSPELKPVYSKSTMSIWDAYNAGVFGQPGSKEAKSARNYLILDAIANFTSNLGRDVGNVGAQFTGGSIDNREDQSLWSQRQDEMAAEERAIEKEYLGGPAQRRRINEELTNEINELAKNKSATVNDLINTYKKRVDDPNTNALMREVYTKAITGLAGANISATPISQAMGSIGPILQGITGIASMFTSDAREKVGSSFLGR